MEIFRIREGEAPSQSKDRYAVLVLGEPGLPGVQCLPPPDGCGDTWGASGQRMYKELPADHFLRSMGVWPVPLHRFSEIVSDVRRALDLSADAPLLPGTNFGWLSIKMRHQNIVDLSSPEGLGFVITDRFRQFLIEGGFTGWRVEAVNVIRKRQNDSIPLLHELVIEGKGGAAITKPPRLLLSRCAQCGHEKWDQPILESLELNTDIWDGSDIFRFDAPFQGYAFVTKRLADALRNSNLTNIELNDITEVLRTINQFAKPSR